MNLQHHFGKNAIFEEITRSSCCSRYRKPHLTKSLRDRENCGLIRVVHRNEHGSFRRQHRPAGGLRLRVGFPDALSCSYDLSGGAHFRPEQGVHRCEPVEREDGLFHRPPRKAPPLSVTVPDKPLRFEVLPLPKTDGRPHEIDAARLRQEGDRSGSSGIHLQHIEHPLLHGKLNVEKPSHTYRARDGNGGGDHLTEDFRRRLIDGEDAGAVARVDTGGFDMFADSGDVDVRSVAERVEVVLEGVFQELIHQYGRRLAQRDSSVEELLQLVAPVGDEHVLTADNVGGAQQHRVADLLRRGRDVLAGTRHPVFRLTESQSIE